MDSLKLQTDNSPSRPEGFKQWMLNRPWLWLSPNRWWSMIVKN